MTLLKGVMDHKALVKLKAILDKATLNFAISAAIIKESDVELPPGSVDNVMYARAGHNSCKIVAEHFGLKLRDYLRDQ